jgi:hypothetical protein
MAHYVSIKYDLLCEHKDMVTYVNIKIWLLIST